MKKVAVLLSLAVVCGPAFAADGPMGQLMQTAGVSEMPKVAPIANVTAVQPGQITGKVACMIEGSVKQTVYGFLARTWKTVEGSGTLACHGYAHPFKMAFKGEGPAPGVQILPPLLGRSESESREWSVQFTLPVGLNPEMLGGTWDLNVSGDAFGASGGVYFPSAFPAAGIKLGLPKFPSLSAGASVTKINVTVSQ